MNTGIYRRIDDLGRIVIPKDVRSKLHLETGDMMEIVIADRKIMLLPYSPMTEAAYFIETCLNALDGSRTLNAIVTSKTEVIASHLHGLPKYTLLSEELKALLLQRKVYVSNGAKVPVSPSVDQYVAAMFPINRFGELHGSLVLVGDDTAENTIQKGRLLANIISEAVRELE